MAYNPYAAGANMPQGMPQIPQPNGWAGKMSGMAGNNQNMLLQLGLGLLDKRQNNAVPFSAIGQQAMAGREQDQERQARNMTVEWLMKNKGLDRASAQAAVANPLVLKEYLTSEGDEYGLTPIYGTDASGKPSFIQAGKNGQPIQPQLPEGFNLGPGFEKIDLGTSWGILDRNGQITQTVPKDVAGEAAQKELGASQGTAEAGVPKVAQAVETMKGMITDVRNDPGRGAATGMSSWKGSIPGTAAYDFARKVEQLHGQAFLQQFETLKGAGAITEREGAAATAAMARLDRSQTEEGFLKALDDLEAIIDTAVQRMQQRAGQALPPQQPAPAGMSDLYQKYGLEP